MPLKKVVLACLITAISNSSLAAEQNWTIRHGGDAGHTGYVNIKTDPAKMHALWTKTLKLDLNDGQRNNANWDYVEDLIVVDHTVYFTMTQYYYEERGRTTIYPTSALIALDTVSGQTKWQKVIDGDSGISIPVYDDKGRVLINVDTDQGRFLQAYLPDGQLDYSIPSYGYTFDGPLAYHGNYYSQAGKKLESYNTKTGKLNWSHNLRDNIEHPHMIALDDKYIIQADERIIQVFDTKSGKKLYEMTTADGWEDQPYRKIPVYDAKNQLVYYGFRNADDDNEGYGSIFAFDLNTRKVKWKAPHQLLQSILAEDELYVIGEGADKTTGEEVEELHVLDAKTGKPKWSWQPPPATFSVYNPFHNMLATQDLVFIPGAKKTIAISRKTHEKVWEIDAAGELAIADNKLIIYGYPIDQKKIIMTVVALS